ncbi:hypothetical protein ACFQY5_01120 [Paeniroseomonas aquatica]|uniref:hypothetical protein n=1 Tax=Paeniroseomonas aquatica TaxID=373043 RepID=UPI003622FC08
MRRGLVGRAELPLAVALAIAPAAGVLQSKALAPIAVVALAGCVLAHRRALGGWSWPVDFPRNILAGLALATFGWAALTAAWAPEPWRALGTALQLGGFVALGIAAARAVAADAVAAQRRLLRLATAGLVGGLALAGLDAASGNAIRAAVRGLETIPPGLAFGLKPAASAMALWLPLVAAAPLPRWLRALVLLGGAAVLVALPGKRPSWRSARRWSPARWRCCCRGGPPSPSARHWRWRSSPCRWRSARC